MHPTLELFFDNCITIFDIGIETYIYSCTEPCHSEYSHLSNKRDITLTNFEKFHPTKIKNPPYTFIDFLDFSTLHSTFIRFMY